jgi:hypothetical protein
LERACLSSNEPVFVTLHPESSKNRLIREMHGSSLERACHGKLFSSNEPVFVTLHPESSNNRLIRETQGSSLERARGKFFSATLRGPLSIAGAVKNSWA